MGCKNILKLTEYQREKWPLGMIHVELYRAVNRRTLISFKDSEYWGLGSILATASGGYW